MAMPKGWLWPVEERLAHFGRAVAIGVAQQRDAVGAHPMAAARFMVLTMA